MHRKIRLKGVRPSSQRDVSRDLPERQLGMLVCWIKIKEGLWMAKKRG
jgi:hypothetical protein